MIRGSKNPQMLLIATFYQTILKLMSTNEIIPRKNYHGVQKTYRQIEATLMLLFRYTVLLMFYIVSKLSSFAKIVVVDSITIVESISSGYWW